MFKKSVRCWFLFCLLLGSSIVAFAQKIYDPLDRTRVMSLVVGGVLDENVAAEIGKRGVSFRPTPAYLAMLKEAGAGEAVLIALRHAKSGSAAVEDDAEMLEQLSQINKHLRAQEYREAASQASAAMRKHPGNLELAFVMGQILRQAEQFPMAAGVYAELLEQAPEFPYVNTKFAYILYRLGEPHEVIQRAHAALEENPNDAEAHKNLALGLQEEAKYDAALLECKEALRLHPGYASVYYNMGLIYSDKRDLPEAITAYRKAIAIDPSFYNSHYNLGMALADAGDLEGAIAQYRAAKKIDASRVEARTKLGWALTDRNQIAAAEEEFRSLVKTDPNYATGHCGLAWVLRREHNPQAALQESLTAVRLEPGDVCAHRGAGHAYQDLKQFKEAVSEYRRVVELAPSDGAGYWDLGMLLFHELKDPANGIMFMKQAVRLEPDITGFHKELAEMLDATGETQAALDEYAEGQKLAPKDASFSIARAKLFEKQGRYAASLQEYRHAVELDGYLMKQYKEAEQKLTERIEALKKSGDQEALARATSELKESQNAALTPTLEWQTNLYNAQKATAESHLDEAEKLWPVVLKQAEALQPKDRRLISTLTGFANYYRAKKQYKEAEELLQRALRESEQIFGAQADETVFAENVLGSFYYVTNDLAGADRCMARALEITEAKHGSDSSEVASQLVNIGSLYTKERLFDKAESTFQRALTINEKLSGEGIPVYTVVSYMGRMYEAEGKYDKAEQVYRRALAIGKQVFGAKSPAVAQILTTLSSVMKNMGRADEAAQLDAESQEIAKAAPSTPDHQ